jgi:hypothetical protein
MQHRRDIETTEDRNDALQTEYRSATEWVAIAGVLAVGYKDELIAGGKKIADKISGGDKQDPKK